MKIQYTIANSRDVKALLAALQVEGKKLKAQQVESIRFLVIDPDVLEEAESLKAYGLVAPVRVELLSPPDGWVGAEIPTVKLAKGRRPVMNVRKVHANAPNGAPIPRSSARIDEARAASIKRMNALVPNC